MPDFLKSYMNPCRTVIARRRLLLKPSSMYAFQSLYDDSWLEFLGPRRKQAVCMFQKYLFTKLELLMPLEKPASPYSLNSVNDIKHPETRGSPWMPPFLY